MDGNFAAEHIQSRSGDRDVLLSPGMAFMANPKAYKSHLKSGQESIQVHCLIIYLYCLSNSYTAQHMQYIQGH
jgi:hypothetical protein